MHAAATVPPSLLQLLLERYGPGIDESFLHLVAALHDINVVGRQEVQYVWVGQSCDEPGHYMPDRPAEYTYTASCSDVRQIARQELIRRGPHA